MSLFHHLDYVTLGAKENAREVNRITKELEANGYLSSVMERAKISEKKEKKEDKSRSESKKTS